MRKLQFLLCSLLVFATQASLGEGLPISQIHLSMQGDPAKEALVLVHGNGLGGESFKPIIDDLASDYYVITYDQRGQGQTRYEGLDFSVQAMVDDLDAVIKSLNLRQVHLVGHSFGARVAVAYAEKFPLRVKTLTIEDMEMSARTSVDSQYCARLGDRMLALNRDYPSVEAAREALHEYYGNNGDSLQKVTVESLPNGGLRVVSNPYGPYVWGCFANAADLSSAFHAFAKNILILRADPLHSALSEMGLAQMLRLQPNAEVINFPGSHHVIHLYDPGAVIQALRKFLSNSEFVEVQRNF